MNKKVLIISSTPRKGGNSDILCDEFAAGAKEAGNKVEKVRIADRKIGYCTGCYACQKTGKCAIKDDAQKVIDKMMEADVIVLASPVYFYCISAQLKVLFDRTVVVYPNLTNKKFYFILTMADTNRKMFDGSFAALHGFLACCEGSKECGKVCANGVYEKGTIKDTKFMSAAHKLGMKVKWRGKTNEHTHSTRFAEGEREHGVDVQGVPRKAVEAARHKVTLVNVAHMKIAGCLACGYCHGKRNGA